MFRRVVTRSDSPTRSLWEHLSVWENQAEATKLVSERYQGSSEVDINRLGALFSYYLVQAREYFRAAHAVSPLTRPVLVFYGMVNVAKLLIVLSKPTYPERDDEEHGFGKWSGPFPYNLLEDTVKPTRKGTFPLLQTALGLPDLTGRDFSLGSLLSILPELADSLGLVCSLKSRVVPVQILSHLHGQAGQFPDGHVAVGITARNLRNRNALTLEQAKRRFGDVTHALGLPEAAAYYFRDRLVLHWKMEPGESYEDSVSANFISGVFGGYYATDMTNLEGVSEETALYMVSFALSMLCRYRPDLWSQVALVNNSTTGILIDSFLELASRKFPNLVLNRITGRNHLFVHAGQ